MARLTIGERRDGDVTVLTLGGGITTGDGAITLRQAIRRLANEGRVKIVLALSAVDQVDEDGIGELCSAHTTIMRAGGQLKMSGLDRTLDELVTVTKLVMVFDTYEDERHAIDSFR